MTVQNPRSGEKSRIASGGDATAFLRQRKTTADLLGVPLDQLLGHIKARTPLYDLLYADVAHSVERMRGIWKDLGKGGLNTPPEPVLDLKNLRGSIRQFVIHGNAASAWSFDPPADFTLDYMLNHRDSDFAIRQYQMTDCGSWADMEERWFQPKGPADICIGALNGRETEPGWYRSLPLADQWHARERAFENIEPELREHTQALLELSRGSRALDRRFKFPAT